MSIFPSTDLISDVARAADPGRLKLATKRLEDIGAEKARGLDHAFTLASAARPRTSAFKAPTTVGDDAPAVNRLETVTPMQKFEAYLLQSWLEDILPKTGGGTYGTEAGADIWRSMMAEQIGLQLARANVVGLQKLLDHQNSALSVKPA